MTASILHCPGKAYPTALLESDCFQVHLYHCRGLENRCAKVTDKGQEELHTGLWPALSNQCASPLREKCHLRSAWSSAEAVKNSL